MLLAGGVVTSITYAVLWFLSAGLLAWYDLHRPAFAHALAVIYLLAATVSVVRQSRDYWTDLQFSTTDPNDRISDIEMTGSGGRLWNMNVTSPKTVGAFAKIFSVLIGAGPDMLVQGVKTLMELRLVGRCQNKAGS